MDLVTPKAGAEHELLLNEPASAFDLARLTLKCQGTVVHDNGSR